MRMQYAHLDKCTFLYICILICSNWAIYFYVLPMSMIPSNILLAQLARKFIKPYYKLINVSGQGSYPLFFTNGFVCKNCLIVKLNQLASMLVVSPIIVIITRKNSLASHTQTKCDLNLPSFSMFMSKRTSLKYYIYNLYIYPIL